MAKVHKASAGMNLPAIRYALDYLKKNSPLNQKSLKLAQRAPNPSVEPRLRNHRRDISHHIAPRRIEHEAVDRFPK
jgi:hypothetical protein